MKNRFLENIKKNNLFSKEDKLIVAISGGADSVALAILLNECNFPIIFAHCNFNLREDESDADEDFVRKLAKELEIECFVESFETEKFAKENKISIQMAARELRYSWLEKIRIKTDSKYIAVAHHKDDDIETYFINLIRGSGIRGFLGMKEKKNKIIRPLLNLRRDEIESYLMLKNQEFRTDSSNTDTKYLRNNIRKHIIPIIKDVNPSFSNTFSNELEYMNDVFKVFQNVINDEVKHIVLSRIDDIILDKNNLLKSANKKILLRELIFPFGFSQTEQILNSCNDIAGKIFYSKSHRLLVDRNKIIISELKNKEEICLEISENSDEINFPINLRFAISEELDYHKSEGKATFDFDRIKFPIQIRKWKEGDYFHPIGMKGKKKLSDFFIDEKLSRFEKEKCFIMCSDEKIMWIIGHRMDDRFKITNKTKKAYIAGLF
ncbi:MAG: tRNA lysidine(34) synthetase TilS [Flavobacteriales bacterium]|jgi:tRNA(Ile)-lysidine synthase|nr:tRNA lysidine(34) synthetase TilS [Flavobacteriales bacterium]